MTAKIFRNSFFVGLLVLLAAGILFLSVMYAVLPSRRHTPPMARMQSTVASMS